MVKCWLCFYFVGVKVRKSLQISEIACGLLINRKVYYTYSTPSKLSGCLASDLRSFVSLVVAGTLVAGDLVTFLGTSVLTYNLNGLLKS